MQTKRPLSSFRDVLLSQFIEAPYVRPTNTFTLQARGFTLTITRAANGMTTAALNGTPTDAQVEFLRKADDLLGGELKELLLKSAESNGWLVERMIGAEGHRERPDFQPGKYYSGSDRAEDKS